MKKRNFLVHHYFSERAIEITTDTGCEKMVQELINTQSFFSAIESEISVVTDELSIKYDFTEEVKESVMQQKKLVRSGKSEDDQRELTLNVTNDLRVVLDELLPMWR